MTSDSDPHKQAAVSQTAVEYAHRYLAERRPIVLPLSPGNTYFFNEENLLKVIQFASSHSDCVKIFIPDIISEHNYRAIGSSNPERASKKKANYLLNKFNKLLAAYPALCPSEMTYVDWRKDVETSCEYTKELEYMMTLFETNKQFQRDLLEVTETALHSLWKWKISVTTGNRNNMKESGNNDLDRNSVEKESSVLKEERNKDGVLLANPSIKPYDVSEGVNYILKEYAFLFSIPKIYSGFDRYVFIYHKQWPILTNLANGVYDNKERTCLGFVILE